MVKGHILSTFCILIKIVELEKQDNNFTTDNNFIHVTEVFGENLEYNNIENSEENRNSSLRISEKTPILSLFPPGYFIRTCPLGLKYHEVLTIPFCYVLTEKQAHPPKCPYKNYLEYETITSIYNEHKNKKIWARIKRKIDDGFGQFYDSTPSPKFLNVVKKYEAPTGTITDKGCMIRKNGKLIPVRCSEMFPMLCIYSYTKSSISKFCTKRNNFNDCVSSNLNVDNKCYCRTTTEGIVLARKNFCHKLAEPKEPFQNSIILSQLKGSTQCWFGVEKSEAGIFQWSSTKTPVTDFNWKRDANLSNNLGFLDFTGANGWNLESDDKRLTCGICEVEVEYQKVSVHLKYNAQNNQIVVRVENVFDVHNYFLFHYVLSCFSDANTEDLTEKPVSFILDVLLNSRIYNRTIKVNNNYPSHYWCVTLQRPSLSLVRSNKILVYNNDGKHNNEYSLIVTVNVPRSADPFLANLHVIPARHITKKLETTNMINVVRPMKVLSFAEHKQQMQLLLHLSTLKNRLDDDEEYSILFDTIADLPNQPDSRVSQISSFLRSDICMPGTSWSKNLNISLNWRKTLIGVSTTPTEICLKKDYLPVIRKCTGSFLTGGEWSKVEGDCSKVKISNTTRMLYDLISNENVTVDELKQTLLEVTSNSTDIITYDVHLITDAIQKLLEMDDDNHEPGLNIVSNIMDFEQNILKAAQGLLNSTDRILDSLDAILKKTDIDNENATLTYSARNLLVYLCDLRVSNITGFAVSHSDGKKYYEVIELRGAAEMSSLNDVEVAVLLQPKYISELFECAATYPGPIKLTFTFFHNEILFNEESQEKQTSNSRIIGVFVADLECEIETPLRVIFKPLNGKPDSACGYWKFGVNELKENTHGHWVNESLSKLEGSSYLMCEFSHTTHFALLMHNEIYKGDEISPAVERALNIITAIGCFLSLFGICGIYFTAIFFKSWRVRSQNIIMLNFSTAVAAQMILLFVADHAPEDYLICIISGICLHYTILSEFVWMLILAILQYRKFVIVFSDRIWYLVPKCMIVAWGFPLVPVVAFLIVNPNSYGANIYGICYPVAEYFFIGIAVPVTIITIINTFIFIKIVISVCSKKVDAYGQKANQIKLQVLLALLLFFLLGVTWIFGLASAFAIHIIFSFLFCITATLQGFVLFMYFVVLNKTSQNLWSGIKKVCLCIESYPKDSK